MNVITWKKKMPDTYENPALYTLDSTYKSMSYINWIVYFLVAYRGSFHLQWGYIPQHISNVPPLWEDHTICYKENPSSLVRDPDPPFLCNVLIVGLYRSYCCFFGKYNKISIKIFVYLQLNTSFLKCCLQNLCEFFLYLFHILIFSMWLNKRLVLYLHILVVQFWCKTSYSIFIHFIHCHKSVDIFIYMKKIINFWTHDSKLPYFQALISSDVLLSFARATRISNSM